MTARAFSRNGVRLHRQIRQNPASVRGPHELRPPRENRVRHVLGDNAWSSGKTADVPDQIHHIGGTRREIVERPRGEQSVFRLGVNSARQLHGSSRVIGQVMQCGPPPPRTSSPPSNVMAARWFAGISVSLDRKSDAEIILKPAFSSSRNVVSFRAYEVITPGRSVVLLQPDAHCSRSWTILFDPPQRIGSIGSPQCLSAANRSGCSFMWLSPFCH